MKEPAYTCPKIDKYIKDLKRESDSIRSYAESLSDDIQSAFEELRTLNSELRDWGRAGWDKAEELENEIEDLKQNCHGYVI